MIYIHRLNKKFDKGDILYTKFGNCIICDIIYYKKVKIKFIKTGYETYVRMGDLKNGNVKDYLYPSVCGVGFLGNNFKNIKKNKLIYKKAYQVWIDMLKRCYDKNRKGYKSYGKKGVKVSNEWLNFSTFYKDIFNLPGFDKQKFLNNEIFLDKDKLQINISHSKRIYSKNTCVFLSREENNMLQNHDDEYVTFKVTYPNGNSEIVTGIREFARLHNIYYTNICACLKNKQKTYKNMKFEKIE